MKMDIRRIKKWALALLFCALATGGVVGMETASADEEFEGEKFTEGDLKGIISRDGKRCWIQHISDDMIRNNTLTIPSVVKGATVVRISGTPESYSGAYENNAFAQNANHCFGPLSKKCKNLKRIVLPDSIETIGEECFAYLNGLESVRLPKRLKAIESHAFERCRSLKSLQFPATLRTIGECAFMGCKRLQSVSMGGNVGRIANTAFCGCFSLGRVSINKKNKRYGVGDGYIYEKNKKSIFLIYAQQSSFSIPEGIETLSRHCFQSGAIKTIYVPASVRKIKNNAFSVNQEVRIVVSRESKWFANLGRHVVTRPDGILTCMYAYNVKRMELPEGVKIIQRKMSVIGTDYPDLTVYALDDSPGFTEIIFPSTLKELRIVQAWNLPKLFDGVGVARMEFKGKVPPTFGYFNYYHTLYIPAGTTQAYEEAFSELEYRDFTLKEMPRKPY